MSEPTHAYLIGGPHGRSENMPYSDPTRIANAWVERDDPMATIRLILDDGSHTHGTYEQVRPILDAVDRIRAAKEGS